MQYRRLGRSGLKVSALSLGSWVTFDNQLDIKQAMTCMKAAYDQGINFFDNAEAYAQGASEVIMGKALQKLAWSRDSYIVSSKVFFGAIDEPLPTQRGLSIKHVTEACHQALNRLQVDYLDLYYCHRPDPETPIEETVRAMHNLIQQGKILYWGTSEWSAQEIMEAYAVARQYNLTPPTMEQPQYNLFNRQRVEQEYQRLYSEIGLGTTIWSPLYYGILTGKYSEGGNKDSRLNLPKFQWLHKIIEGEDGQKKLDIVNQLKPIAESAGMTPAQLAITWCLKNPNVSTVILGASSAEQLLENIKTIDLLSHLTDNIVEEINQMTQPLAS